MAIDKKELNWLSKIGADTVPQVIELHIELLSILADSKLSVPRKLKTLFLVAPYVIAREVHEDLAQWNFEANGGLARRERILRDYTPDTEQ